MSAQGAYQRSPGPSFVREQPQHAAPFCAPRTDQCAQVTTGSDEAARAPGSPGQGGGASGLCMAGKFQNWALGRSRGVARLQPVVFFFFLLKLRLNVSAATSGATRTSRTWIYLISEFRKGESSGGSSALFFCLGDPKFPSAPSRKRTLNAMTRRLLARNPGFRCQRLGLTEQPWVENTPGRDKRLWTPQVLFI